MFEPLKPLAEVLSPDPRMAHVNVRSADRQSAERITFERFYELVEHESLPPHVPEEIRQQFETVRNVYVYAWFCYRIYPVAALQAFATLENALRVALAELDQKKPPSFARLLSRASKDGRLVSGSFRDKTVPMGGLPQSGDPEAFVASMVRIFPLLRNELAHGRPMLWPDYLHTLRIVRDALVQLFPTSQPAES